MSDIANQIYIYFYLYAANIYSLIILEVMGKWNNNHSLSQGTQKRELRGA